MDISKMLILVLIKVDVWYEKDVVYIYIYINIPLTYPIYKTFNFCPKHTYYELF